MKRYILALGIILGAYTTHAQLTTPSLSPSARLIQTVGLTEIEINYSRPGVKGRKIFAPDGLVPFGEVWRTGANAATKIHFSSPVTMGGKTLKKGSYALLSIPGKASWQINWYSYESGNWSSYLKQEVLLTQQIPVSKTESLIESFDIHIQSLDLEGANLVLAWEHTAIIIPIRVHTKEKVLENISRTMAGPSSNDYYQAALYLHESGTDVAKALEYIQQVTVSEKALFFQVTREALILRDLKRKKEAVEVAKRALSLSTKADNKDFIRINAQLIEELSY